MQWNDVPRAGWPVRLRGGEPAIVREIDHRHRLVQIAWANGTTATVPPEELETMEDDA